MLRSLSFTPVIATLASALKLNVTYPGYINYTTVTGYFLQDEPSTNATTFLYNETNFGLINRAYPATAGITARLTQWERFEAQVNYMNANAPLNTVYKVLFMGRHGDGYHNDAEAYYGTPAWNCYWAELYGNETIEWFDAALSPLGVAQAQVANDFWRHEIAHEHIPYPQSYYTSPLTRCLQTANVSFFGLDLPVYYPFIPTVKELFREGISIHTCDRRRNKTYIHNLFPDWNIEPGFSEDDELWNGVTAEDNAAQDARSLTVLDEVFSTDDHTWISITSHSGEIASILRVLGHQPFSSNTGAVIPVLVEAKFLPTVTSISTPPWTTSTHCTNPPITSISSLAQGCVCSGSAAVTTPLYNLTSYTLHAASTLTLDATSTPAPYPTTYGS